MDMNKAPWRTLLLLPPLIVIVGVIWVYAGRNITLLVDRITTSEVATTRVDHLQYDGGGFGIAGLSLDFGTLNNQRFDLALKLDPLNRVVLCSGGKSFVLGPLTSPVDSSGRPDIAFAADAHDTASLSITRSLLSWPTPLPVNFMVRTPWWKRYVYYRLVWRKPSGAELTMLWRYEQDYYTGDGWTRPAMMWNWQTGLLAADIRSQAS
jgi:hypothetical protein